ncbi:SIS domain-containing protein [Enterococcus asini]|uniref:SIS domain-containing protein n=1 Tax=Enterococcus asini TaxID=57732 RepID=UPI0013871026|nr:SIS domain-containing protein [Enterococcus asini]MDT2745109.1 SIS domain-containing protein [Enterococcus asini]
MLKFNETEYKTNLTNQIEAIQDGKKVADEIAREGYKNIFFVAVGGTVAMMMHFEEIAKEYSDIPVFVAQAGELVLTGHKQLTKDSLVIMGSKSGDTKETVAAAKWCKERGYRVASMVIDPESPLGKESTWCLPLKVFKGVEYEYLCIFGLFYGLLANNHEFPDFDEFYQQLHQYLPEGLTKIQKDFDEKAAEIAGKYYNADYQLWIGGGELWGEVYLYTMCILEEMQWIRTKSVRTSEFFHGTIELVEKGLPVFLVKGVGKCRSIDNRAEKFLKEYADELVIIDVKDYLIDGIDEKFAPLVSPIISTALLNGRLSKHFENKTGHDLDTRRYYRQFEY